MVQLIICFCTYIFGVFVVFRWYYDNLSRAEAEEKLSQVTDDGAFLVRFRKPDAQAYVHEGGGYTHAVSFR